VYLEGKKLITVVLIGWEVDDKFNARLHLVQAVFEDPNREKLEPGMDFSGLEVKICTEKGNVWTMAKFKDIHFDTLRYKISIDDIMTEKIFSMSGTFVPVALWEEE
jgi:hypothetical protein